MGEFITAEEAKRIINERTVERINDGIKRACEQGYTSCSVGNVLDLPTEVVNNILRRLKECGYILYPEAIGFTQVILGITWDDKWDKQKYLDSCKAHYKDTIPSSYEFLLECYTMFDFD